MIHADNSASAEQIVRDGLAAADRRRRAREASRRIWRIAPGLAGAALVLAAIGRAAHWPVAVPAGILIVSAVAIVLYAWASRRARPVSDAIAAAIDADAGMGGELRSASWFARKTTRDEWADFHLAAAAARLGSLDWKALYPSIRARRAQAATAVLTVAALGLVITIPQRNRLHAAAAAVSARPAGHPAGGPPSGEIAVLDPELQKLLEELLALAAAGTLPTAQALAANPEMLDLLSKLNQMNDRELLEALKRALAANPDLQAKTAAQNLKSLAEQTTRTADGADIPEDLQNALEKLADEIEIAKPQSGDRAASSAGAAQQGQTGESNPAGSSDDLSIQFAKEADAGGGSGMLMMSSQNAQSGGAPGSGVGGSGSQESAAAAAAALLDAALKQEMVEASQDTTGQNVESDIRRKTEHGNATTGFSGVAAGTFDRSRAAAAPPVPEARRSGVQTYFVRKPK